MLKHNQNSGIIYTRTRKEAENLTEFCKKINSKCRFFHAGLSVKEKHQSKKNGSKANQNVLISTNAFGMGIDKENVRFVIHFHQHIFRKLLSGNRRAGRDGGEKSYAFFTLE